MAVVAENALIVQSDNTVLLEVHSPRAEAAREALAPFAELVKSPEHVHTYRLTPLSIWNARSAGLSGATMIAALRQHAKYAVPDSVVTEVGELAARYGRVVLTREGDALVCTCRDRATAERLARDKGAGPFLADRIGATHFRVSPASRGVLKQALVAAGFPAEDLAGYATGDELRIALRDRCLSGLAFDVRDYQREAAGAFYLAGSERGGSGVIALPCGADVLIQVSGMFGSRQEEAQRLGRILRPKADGRTAHFFSLVSRDTREEEFAHHRQLFLTEQGYSYRIEVAPGVTRT